MRNQVQAQGLLIPHPDPKALTPGRAPHSPRAVTFVRGLESQGAATAVCLEEEPHLMVGADNEIWDRRTCQAVRRERFRGVHPTMAPRQNDCPTEAPPGASRGQAHSGKF